MAEPAPPRARVRLQGSSLPCAACGGEAQSGGMLQATPQEAADGGGRVEGFVCGGCGAVARFPRYTNPRKLLDTRRGRRARGHVHGLPLAHALRLLS